MNGSREDVDVESASDGDNKYHKTYKGRSYLCVCRKFLFIAFFFLVLTVIYNVQTTINLKVRNGLEYIGLLHVQWFDLSSEIKVEQIKSMTSTEVDNLLYKLSRWEAFTDYDHWTKFVRVSLSHTIYIKYTPHMSKDSVYIKRGWDILNIYIS